MGRRMGCAAWRRIVGCPCAVRPGMNHRAPRCSPRRPLRRRGSPMLLMGTGLREENISGPQTNENAPTNHVVCKVQIVYKVLLERWVYSTKRYADRRCEAGEPSSFRSTVRGTLEIGRLMSIERRRRRLTVDHDSSTAYEVSAKYVRTARRGTVPWTAEKLKLCEMYVQSFWTADEMQHKLLDCLETGAAHALVGIMEQNVQSSLAGTQAHALMIGYESCQLQNIGCENIRTDVLA
jgi:hypothetical protein